MGNGTTRFVQLAQRPRCKGYSVANPKRWGLEGEAFDTLAELGGETPTSPTVAPSLADQTRQALGGVALDPSLQGPEC